MRGVASMILLAGLVSTAPAVPARADGQREIQSNDVGADEHGRLYLIDRWDGGMHIVEYTG